MIDTIFGKDDNTIEVCSGNVKGNCFKVDINPSTNPDLVEDGQRLTGISDGRFSRGRWDPPYNNKTANEMYGPDLPSPLKLLKAGARVCKSGSLMFMLLTKLLKTSLQYSHPPLLSASKLDYNQNLPCMLPGSHLRVFRSRLTTKEIVKHIY